MAKPARADTMQAEMHLRFLKDTPTWKHKFNANILYTRSRFSGQKTTRDLTAFQNAALKNVARCQLGVQLALTNACLLSCLPACLRGQLERVVRVCKCERAQSGLLGRHVVIESCYELKACCNAPKACRGGAGEEGLLASQPLEKCTSYLNE